MKQITIEVCTLPKNLLKIFAFLISLSITQKANAQPSWGFGPAAATASEWQIPLWNVNSNADVETINCDMYTDMSSGSPCEYLMAVVWDEYDFGTSTWHVYADVRDKFLGTVPMSVYHIASGARHPDVVIMDGSNNSRQAIGIVYETTGTTPQVMYVEYELRGLASLCSPGGALNWAVSSTPTAGPTSFNADITHDAHDPHIDAMIDYNNGAWYGGGNNYEPLQYYAVSWTEDDGSSSYEIWLDNGSINSAPNGNATLIDNGTKSDIACVNVDNNSSRIAYITYINASGDVQMQEFDVTTTPSWNATTAIQTSLAVSSQPRIDAPNVHQTSSPPNRLWGITAAFTISSQEEIRFYDDVGMTDFGGSNQPYSSGANGYYPALAIGPGPNDYNSLTNFGNQYFIHAGFINDGTYDNIEASDYFINGTPSFGAYKQVSTAGIHTNAINPPLGVGSSSNCGEGHIAAWLNYDVSSSAYTIDEKVNTGATMAFKPTGVTAAKKQSEYIAYPNPAADYVIVNGLTSTTTFNATDITGRSILHGEVSPQSNRINIAQLPKGVYVFKFNEDGTTTQLKLIKK